MVIILSPFAQIRLVHLIISNFNVSGCTWFIIDLNKEVEVMKNVFGFFVICFESKLEDFSGYYFVIVRVVFHQRWKLDYISGEYT